MGAIVEAATPAGAVDSAAPPDQIALTGTVRDFQGSHPDFQSYNGDDRGIVTPTIGPDRKPVYAYTPPDSSPTTTSKDNDDDEIATLLTQCTVCPFEIVARSGLREVGRRGGKRRTIANEDNCK